jgi:LuxR family maltose regulon positive regulatory protein
VPLATKLHVPGPRPGFVSRPRLAQRLDEGAVRGLVLVCAPAGSGKTALLADWARSGQRLAAWLSLDDADNDPARFWHHAVAALDRACPGIGERVSPLLGPPAPASFEPLVTALINELTAQPGDGQARLVLDDYHLIGSQPVHASLGFLLDHRPPGLGVVLASRADPPLPLARLRARGQLAELRARGHGSTREQGTLSREAASADLPDAAVTALTDHPKAGRRAAARGPVLRPDRCKTSWRRSPAATATCWTSWPKGARTAARAVARSCWGLGAGRLSGTARRGDRLHRQPGDAGAGGAGGIVPAARG